MCISIHPPKLSYKRLSDALQRRVRACGASMVYVDDTRSPTGRRVVMRQSCGLAVCPTCAAYKDKKRQEAIAKKVQELVTMRPTAFFYSLTIKGSLVSDGALVSAIRGYTDGLTKLLRTAFMQRHSIGYVRAVEVKAAGRRHNAHLHALLVFDVGGDPFDRAALERLCRRYFGADGCHLTPIQEAEKYPTIAAAVVGFARYIAKSAVSTSKAAVSHAIPYFQHIIGALRGVRRYSAGGLLRGALKSLPSTADAVADGEALYRVSRKSGAVVKAFYDAAKGVLGSFGIGRKRKKTPPPPPEPPKQPIADPDNRVLSALAAFDAQTAAHAAYAAATNAPYRSTG